MKFAVYLSGHGFGHATRMASVMQELHRTDPDSRFLVRTMAPRRIIAQYCSAPFHLEPALLDAAAVERDVLSIDAEETLRRVIDVQEREAEIVERELAALARFAPDAILFDLPPLAPVIAQRLGVPSIGIGNFTWSFIYQAFAATMPGKDAAIDRIRSHYARTSLLLRLPLCHAMEEFPSIVDIPLIARQSTAERASTRSELGLPEGMPAVLIALRGEQVPGLFTAGGGGGFVLLSFGEATHPGVIQLGESWQPRFVDLLAASDLVLSKPGYGVVSECIANGKPLLHLERHGFAESEVLIAGMTPYLRQRRLTAADVAAGGLAAAVDSLLAQPAPSATMQTDGAEVAAGNILQFLRRGDRGERSLT